MTDGSAFNPGDLPSTRFTGSKRRMAPVIEETLSNIKYDTFLDVFGGTASVSYIAKKMRKRVFYNDYLDCNQTIGTALIENNSTKLTSEDIDSILKRKEGKNYQKVIERNFEGIYYPTEENKWLDTVVQNIQDIEDKYKRSLLFSGLFQACLRKRPFNLFHRKNLYLRTQDVERSFGNKTTWERPFDEQFRNFVNEYNSHVFDNQRDNRVIGGHPALEIPNPSQFDLVYLDPPYVSREKSSGGTNYLTYYHFLEGMVNYEDWENMIDYSCKTNKLQKDESVRKWTRKTDIGDLVEELIERYSESKIVFSYRKNGIPSVEQLKDIFERKTGSTPLIKEINHNYALSDQDSTEILIVSQA